MEYNISCSCSVSLYSSLFPFVFVLCCSDFVFDVCVSAKIKLIQSFDTCIPSLFYFLRLFLLHCSCFHFILLINFLKIGAETVARITDNE